MASIREKQNAEEKRGRMRPFQRKQYKNSFHVTSHTTYYTTHHTTHRTQNFTPYKHLLEATQTDDGNHPGALPLLVQHEFRLGQAL